MMKNICFPAVCAARTLVSPRFVAPTYLQELR